MRDLEDIGPGEVEDARLLLAGDDPEAEDVAEIAEAAPADGADAARATALASAQRELAGPDCASTDVTVDVTGFAAPVGTNAAITVTVTCTVSLGDLAVREPDRAEVALKNISTPAEPDRSLY